MTDTHHFIDIDDVSTTDLREILSLARAARDADRAPSMSGRSLGLLFEKPSTRTRVSFESGITQLGGHAVFMAPDDLQLGRGEPICDTARALSGYLDVIAARMTDHETLLELAEHASIPVINALTDLAHPCQTLADLLTIEDHFGTLDGISVAWIGDGNNVANSFAIGAAMTGIDLTVATPPAYGLADDILDRAASVGEGPTIVSDPVDAVADADVVYTDVWVSMGESDDRSDKLPAFDGYQLNDELLAHAPAHTAVMHCLPAIRGEEITDAVLEGDRSIVWAQAENRMYAQQGLIAFLLDGHATNSAVGIPSSYQGELISAEHPHPGASG